MLPVTPLALPNTPLLSPLETVIQKIEMRRGLWTAFHADLKLQFSSRDQGNAACRGELTYHRLDEKMILKCFNDQNQMLFAFRTDDRFFQLYFPSRETVFVGSIFSLADSPDIESHIKPLDLYRALKPMMVPLHRSIAESWDQDVMMVKVFARDRQSSYLSRSFIASHEGDILKEIYYSRKEDPLVTIHRMKIGSFQLEDGTLKNPIFYPQAIRIDSNSKQSTLLAFHGIRFFAFLENANWLLDLPKTTRVIDLEKDEANENPTAVPAELHNESHPTP